MKKEKESFFGKVLCKLGLHKGYGPPPVMTRAWAEKIRKEGYEEDCIRCGETFRAYPF